MAITGILTLYSIIAPFDVFENIMENGAFAPFSIFSKVFKTLVIFS